MKSVKRPYGVGLLVIGYDRSGPHLFETSPSGIHKEFIAQAIGARSQSSRTYLEKFYEGADDLSDDNLIQHCIKSLKGATTGEELTSTTVSVAIVGEDHPFTIIEGEELQRHLDAINNGDTSMATD